jgi:hypothetical protein
MIRAIAIALRVAEAHQNLRRRSMTNRSVVLAVVVLAALTLIVGSVWAQRRGMGNMIYLERAWTAVSFQLNCTDDEIAALKPTFASALDARNTAIQAARQAGGDRQTMMAAIQKAGDDCKATLDAKLNTVLTADQQAALQKLLTPPQRQPRNG